MKAWPLLLALTASAQAAPRYCNIICDTYIYEEYELVYVKHTPALLTEDQIPGLCGGTHQTSPGNYFIERVAYNSCNSR